MKSLICIAPRVDTISPESPQILICVTNTRISNFPPQKSSMVAGFCYISAFKLVQFSLMRLCYICILTFTSNLLAVCTGKVISKAYELEYGQDYLEMHVGAVQPGECALVIDDLVAIGGTLSAAIKLLGEWLFTGNLDIHFSSNVFLILQQIYN